MQNIPQHIAIIMDGNARWAKKNNKSKLDGHKAGAQSIKNILPHLIENKVEYVTLYAFSSENWYRPEDEVSDLMGLLSLYLKKELKTFIKNGVKLKILGNLDKLPPSLKKEISSAVEETKNNNKITVAVAFSYGGREEILNACKQIQLENNADFSEEDFKKHLYDPSMPELDLLIRTSGVHRISNFLLWQIAYAELHFTDTLWPDFNQEDLNIAITDYSNRKRNFGKREEINE